MQQDGGYKMGGQLVQQVQQVQQDDCTAARTTVARWVLWQLPQIVAPNLQHRLLILPKLCHSEVMLKQSDAWIKFKRSLKLRQERQRCHGDATALGSHASGHRHVPGVLDNY